jgi:serine/threonine protein kinase
LEPNNPSHAHLLDFLLGTLAYDPSNRLSTEAALQHPFLSDSSFDRTNVWNNLTQGTPRLYVQGRERKQPPPPPAGRGGGGAGTTNDRTRSDRASSAREASSGQSNGTAQPQQPTLKRTGSVIPANQQIASKMKKNGVP